MTYISPLSARLEQIKNLTLTSIYLGIEEKGGHYHYNWDVTVHFNDKSHNSKFWNFHHTKPNWIIIKGKGFYNQTLGQFKSVKDAHDSGWIKPKAPVLVDVINSLFVDSNCVEGTFEDYCSEFGVSSDSRKELEIYLNCQKTRSAMIKMFGLELFNELSRLEH